MLFGKVLPLFLSLRNAPRVLAIMVALPCVISARTIRVSFFFLLIGHILSTLTGQYIFASRDQQSIAYESFTTKRRMDLSYLSIDRLHESRLSTQPLKVHCSQSDRYSSQTWTIWVTKPCWPASVPM